MHHVTANGLPFAYLEQGTGPLVLLLHGFPDTAYTWEHVLPALAAAGYRAVAPFTRGYHPTALAPDGKYDTDTLARDAIELVGALGAEQAIIVGHDWGASAAYGAAALAPERFRLLVTLAVPHPRGLKPTPRLVWALRHFVSLRGRNAVAKAQRDDFAYIDTLVRRWSPAWQVPPDETKRVKEAFRQPGCLDAAISYYRQVRPPRLPASHRLPIKVPAVAFAGEHDIIAPRAFEKVRHCFEGPYQVVQVPGGHFMHREHPETFATELVRVLADHRARAAG